MYIYSSLKEWNENLLVNWSLRIRLVTLTLNECGTFLCWTWSCLGGQEPSVHVQKYEYMANQQGPNCTVDFTPSNVFQGVFTHASEEKMTPCTTVQPVLAMFLFTRVQTQCHRHVAMTTDRKVLLNLIDGLKRHAVLCYLTPVPTTDTITFMLCCSIILILMNGPKYILFESPLGLWLSKPILPAVQHN